MDGHASPEGQPTLTTAYVPITFPYMSIAIVALILPFIVWRIFKRKKNLMKKVQENLPML
jgi:hypothetical protein